MPVVRSARGANQRSFTFTVYLEVGPLQVKQCTCFQTQASTYLYHQPPLQIPELPKLTTPFNSLLTTRHQD
jgi:hypothetical protein